MRVKSAGFTLIELMIAVAIVGILAAIAYPSYTEYVKKTRRAEIVEILSEQAQTLERNYSKVGTYTTSAGAAPAGLSTGNTYYQINSVVNAQDFKLTAAPIASGIMNNDKCGSFTVTNTGARDNVNMSTGTTSAMCWGR